MQRAIVGVLGFHGYGRSCIQLEDLLHRLFERRQILDLDAGFLRQGSKSGVPLQKLAHEIS